jgi:uncharacterized membrane protein YdjX (TVP38/TMEM64 family)
LVSISVDAPQRVARSKRIWHAVRWAAIALAVVAIVWAALQVYNFDVDATRVWLVDLGPVGPIAYIAVYALQVFVAPIPGLPIGAAAGWVFGFWTAIGYGTLGLLIGIVAAITCGRRWGTRILGRLAGPATVARWEQLRLVNLPLTWLAIFLGPSPDAIIFVAGMTRIPLPTLIVVALVGRAPAMIAATFLGAYGLEIGPWIVVGATLFGILFAGAGYGLRRYVPAVRQAALSD